MPVFSAISAIFSLDHKGLPPMSSLQRIESYFSVFRFLFPKKSEDSLIVMIVSFGLICSAFCGPFRTKVFLMGEGLPLLYPLREGVFSLLGDLYFFPDQSTDFLGDEALRILDLNFSCLLFLIIRLNPNLCAIGLFLI